MDIDDFARELELVKAGQADNPVALLKWWPGWVIAIIGVSLMWWSGLLG